MRWPCDRISDDVLTIRLYLDIACLFVPHLHLGTGLFWLPIWVNLAVRFAQRHMKPHEYLSLFDEEACLLFLWLVGTVLTYVLHFFRP